MASTSQAFYCLWQEENVKEKLFGLLSKEDIKSVRIANSACCNLVTKRLFRRTHLTFTANTFTKPCRIQALSRIGHHIEHLTFYLPHSDATFLPPLIHPSTGSEISFLYTPHTSMASVLARPKYGNSELGDILTQQYPPLFHAATNVPSFINAMKHMANLRHLTIKTPGQNPQERYRRDIVDYALISLRISLERAPLLKLTKLHLSSVHPTAFNYLRHIPGFGCMPSADKRWKQIRKLYISVESWDFYGPSPGLDHLKIIDDYIRHFASALDKLTFTWIGQKGPCPLALAADPLFAPPRAAKKLFNEVTSPMSPLPPRPSVRKPIHFPKLRYLQVRNATMNAPQLSDLVASHRATVSEFDFENVVLTNGGSWDDALAPLMDNNKPGARDTWSRWSLGGSASEAESFRTGGKKSSSRDDGDDDVTIRRPSAAVAQASKELLDIDHISIMETKDLLDIDHISVMDHETGIDPIDLESHIENMEAFINHSDDGDCSALSATDEIEIGLDIVEEESELDEVAACDSAVQFDDVEADADDDLAPDIRSARDASLSFSTKIKKKRVKRRRRKPWHPVKDGQDDNSADEQEVRPSRPRTASDRHSGETASKHSQHHRRERSRSSHRTVRSVKSPRGSSGTLPSIHPSMLQRQDSYNSIPEVIGTDDEENYTFRPRLSDVHQQPGQSMNISAPLTTEPFPVLLQPAIYNPSFSTTSVAHTIASQKSGATHIAHGNNSNEGLSAVQRNLEQEEAQRRFAEDVEARTSALRKAKEAVLLKLSQEFGKKPRFTRSRTNPEQQLLSQHPAFGGGGGPRFGEKPPPMPTQTWDDSAVGVGPNGVAGGGMGARLREGLFGAKSSVSVAAQVDPAASNTTLVPLMFSRG